MNQVILVGNLTDDIELRYTQSGLAVANFTVAVSRKECHNGSWQDVTDGFLPMVNVSYQPYPALSRRLSDRFSWPCPLMLRWKTSSITAFSNPCISGSSL